MVNGTSSFLSFIHSHYVLILTRVRTEWPGTLSSWDLSWGPWVGFRKDTGPSTGVQMFMHLSLSLNCELIKKRTNAQFIFFSPQLLE